MSAALSLAARPPPAPGLAAGLSPGPPPDRLHAAAGRGEAAFSAAVSARPAAGAPTHALGFADLLDVLNPLQHLPLVGSLYRQATGDSLSPAAYVLGGGLWNGLLSGGAGLAVGMAGAVTDAVLVAGTGRDSAMIAGNLLLGRPAAPQLAGNSTAGGSTGPTGGRGDPAGLIATVAATPPAVAAMGYAAAAAHLTPSHLTSSANPPPAATAGRA
ncbi:MAG: hypothetical protein RIE31_00065 [Alphaproteobacteria bacterium]